MKAAREKLLSQYKRSTIKLNADFTSVPMGARRQCEDILKVLKAKVKGICDVPTSQWNYECLKMAMGFTLSKSMSLVLSNVSLVSIGKKFTSGTYLKSRFLDYHLYRFSS